MSAVKSRLAGARFAFPIGYHNLLLQAAIHPDDAIALKAALKWLNENDIDAASTRDNRLLATIISRHGQNLGSCAAYPRLVGVQRLLWTRTMMSAREAAPGLEAIAAAGVGVLAIKGAARMAEGGATARGRIAHDIDIVVRPRDMPAAYGELVRCGWRPSTGQSTLSLAARIDRVRAINMMRGDFGDIDLHGRPFHAIHGDSEADEALWSRACPGALAGAPVLLPGPEDRIALAVGHGSLDAHAHSDWLVDIAMALNTGGIDFSLLSEILESRGLIGSAAIAFEYLSTECGIAVDAAFAAEIRGKAPVKPASYLSALIQSRPKDRSGAFLNIVRWRIKEARKETQRRADGIAGRHDPWLALRRKRAPDAALDNPVMTYRIALSPDIVSADRIAVDIEFAVDAPEVNRRLEFELNTPDRHLARARYRNLWRKPRMTLVLSGTTDLPPGTTELVLSSRPGRYLRAGAEPELVERYGAIPFSMRKVSIRPA